MCIVRMINSSLISKHGDLCARFEWMEKWNYICVDSDVIFHQTLTECWNVWIVFPLSPLSRCRARLKVFCRHLRLLLLFFRQQQHNILRFRVVCAVVACALQMTKSQKKLKIFHSVWRGDEFVSTHPDADSSRTVMRRERTLIWISPFMLDAVVAYDYFSSPFGRISQSIFQLTHHFPHSFVADPSSLSVSND